MSIHFGQKVGRRYVYDNEDSTVIPCVPNGKYPWKNFSCEFIDKCDYQDKKVHILNLIEYSKVYPIGPDGKVHFENGEITQDWYRWRNENIDSEKIAKFNDMPLFYYIPEMDRQLGVAEMMRYVFIPNYKEHLTKLPEFHSLIEMIKSGEDITLVGYGCGVMNNVTRDKLNESDFNHINCLASIIFELI